MVNADNLDIRRISLFAFLSLLCWCLGLMISFVLPSEYLGLTCGLSSQKQPINPMLINTDGLTLKIISNNLECAIINILGFCFLGISTCLNLLYNGLMHGMSIRYSLSSYGIESLYRIIPHSFELLGLFLSGAVGFYSASCLVKVLLCKSIKHIRCIHTFVVFTILSFVIITVAGIVEVSVSFGI